MKFSQACAGYGKSLAFQDVDGALDTGDRLGVIGPNGAGKSTLMRAMVGLVPLSSGAISIVGNDPVAARRDVAYVQQNAGIDPTFPVSAADVVEMGRYRKIGWLRRASKTDRKLVQDALARVEMTGHAKLPFGSLSGGQQQRVMLARAIAQHSSVLLMDEPFNGVDATTVEVCTLVLRELSSNGVTIVVSTHDLELARNLCSKVLLMNNNQVAFGDTAGVLTPPLLTSTFGAKSVAFGGNGSVITTG